MDKKKLKKKKIKYYLFVQLRVLKYFLNSIFEIIIKRYIHK